MLRNLAVFGVLCSLAICFAADAPSATAIASGRYSCVMMMTPDSYMATQVITILSGAQYETHGRGAFTFDAADRSIDFTSGSLAREGLKGKYVASGVVAGGVPKQKGPAIVLSVKGSKPKSNSEYQYCYLATKSAQKKH